MSVDGNERREELKRALHRRVRNSLLDDSTTDDDRYDEDAVPLKTPKGTLGRQEGLVQVSPRYLSDVMRRSDSSSSSHQGQHHRRECTEGYATNDTAAALSRMLTRRASNRPGETDDQTLDRADETPKRSETKKKYLFDDELTPKPASKARTPSPLGRSNTVIQRRSITSPIELGPMSQSHLRTLIATPSSPELLSTPSTGNILINDQSHPDYIQRRAASMSIATNPADRFYLSNPALLGVYDMRIRPASEHWLHGASGMLSKSTRANNSSSDQATNNEGHGGHIRQLTNEGDDFGGIDGKEDSPILSLYQNARERVRSDSDGSQPGPHIYNTHVPRKLVPRSLSNAISLPQMMQSGRKRSFSSQSSEKFSAKPHRQSSSSDFMGSSSGLQSRDIPMAWNHIGAYPASSVYSTHPQSSASVSMTVAAADIPGGYPSSSVYSSRPDSLMSSQHSSLHRITSLHNRLQRLPGYYPSQEFIKAPTARGKSVDLGKLEQRTRDASYHSIHDSLRRQELASAETRIISLPRANTLPKESRFKEDLEEVSAELQRTNPPPRRRVSNFDGSRDSEHELEIRNFRQTGSTWEKALRDHSMEDAALAHTRMGSDAPDVGGPLDTSFNRKSTSVRKPSNLPPQDPANKFLSVQDWHGSHLQERLAAYKISSPAQNLPKKRNSIESPPISYSDPASPVLSTASSWARYPSHTRSERSASPASEKDQVRIRDFASIHPPASSSTAYNHQQLYTPKKPQRSDSFGKTVLNSIKRVYRTQSQELQRRLMNEARGHRSSISEGGVLEYPELEMLGRGSPPPASEDEGREMEMEMIERRASFVDPCTTVNGPKAKGQMGNKKSEEEEAKQWARTYEDCVEYPISPPPPPPAAKVEGPLHGTGEDTEMSVRKREKGVERWVVDAGSGSSELRGSTLDFKRSLELDVQREKDLLGLRDNDAGRRKEV